MTELSKRKIYLKNELSIVKQETLLKVNEKMTKVLQENKIALGLQDSPTLMCSLEEITRDDERYVYVKLALGEEVQTFRKNREATFALTFEATDFIETDIESIDADVLESINFLLSQFEELYQDDNE